MQFCGGHEEPDSVPAAMIHFGAAISIASSNRFSSPPTGYSAVSKKSSRLPEGPAGLSVLSYAEDRIAGGALQIHRSSDSCRAPRRSISELNQTTNAMVFTHDNIRQMFGASRSRVSLAACALQRRGMIHYLLGSDLIHNSDLGDSIVSRNIV
jgi:hypothetical protein